VSTRTKTTVANLALRKIGTYRIEDFDEDSADAEVIRDVWDEVLLQCLSEHEWIFAKKQAQLQQGTTPDARYDYSYRLPSDFVRLGAVSEYEAMEPPMEQFDIIYTVGEPIPSIITDSEYCYVEYVALLTDPAHWAPYFVNYFVAVLAGAIASPLKSTVEHSRLMEYAEKVALPKARGLDSLNQPSKRPPLGSWLRAMRGGVG